MRRLTVFNHITLDGYFVDLHNDMSWAKTADQNQEWNEFVAGNAKGGGELVFGRITYELMASYWPTPMAKQHDPAIAATMNNSPKIVFSRTLDKAPWSNTRLLKGDLASEVRNMKKENGKDLVILGSGSIVSQLTPARLIDQYQLVVNPVVLGAGRTLFHGLVDKLRLKLTKSQAFGNGNVFLCYEPIA